MIHRLLDRLAERYSEREHKLEAMRAREEYFDRAGKVFDDDAELFEGRMASFLEWYVLERPLAGDRRAAGRVRDRRSGDGAARRRAPGAGRRWPPATAACSSCSRHRRPAAGRRGPDRRRAVRGARAAQAAGDDGGRRVRGAAVLGRRGGRVRADVPVPPARRARRRARLGRARGRRRASARDEILFHLSRQHIRWHRLGHVGAAKVYRDA